MRGRAPQSVEDPNGFSMNSALLPQLLKLEDVFDETMKAWTAIQEELKSAILLRWQLKSYLSLTIGDNL